MAGRISLERERERERDNDRSISEWWMVRIDVMSSIRGT
jgi:hypothetical protein